MSLPPYSSPAPLHSIATLSSVYILQAESIVKIGRKNVLMVVVDVMVMAAVGDRDGGCVDG